MTPETLQAMALESSARPPLLAHADRGVVAHLRAGCESDPAIVWLALLGEVDAREVESAAQRRGRVQKRDSRANGAG